MKEKGDKGGCWTLLTLDEGLLNKSMLEIELPFIVRIKEVD